jgi:glycosyltransferase involved in cell wall biosynthesis
VSLSLVVVANARLPSQRAQSLQVIHAAAAFARAGAPTVLAHARRRRTTPLPRGVDLFEHYSVPAGARPEIVEVACLDAIDLVPRALQYLPARLQELSFSRNAARLVRQRFRARTVLSREVEAARALLRNGVSDVFLEVHRVPGGRTRRRWLAEAMAGARGVVAISGGVREELCALGLDPARVVVEHDALEPSRFAALPSREEAREELGLPREGPLVAYTGGLLAWKGAEVLVEAARLLPAVRFVIAGGMDLDVERLRERARGVPNVRIDGFQPPSRVGLYLRAADVGVVPNRSRLAISARYTSPLKVFEAMAVGLPLVASDLPSLRELLEDGLDAVLVEPDDPAALARGIERVLADPGLRHRLSARMLARAPEHTWDARAGRLLAWMETRGAGRR